MGNGTPSSSAGSRPEDKAQTAGACTTVKSNSLSGNETQHSDKAFCLGVAKEAVLSP